MPRKAYWVRNTATSNIFVLAGKTTTPYDFPSPPHNWVDLKPNFSSQISATAQFNDIATPRLNEDHPVVVGAAYGTGPWKGVAHSLDGGGFWVTPSLPAVTQYAAFTGIPNLPPPAKFNKVFVWDDDIIYIAADNGFILKSSNGSQLTPLFDIAARINDPVSPGSSTNHDVRSIHFMSATEGVVGLKDRIYHTIDGGTTWTQISNDLLFRASSGGNTLATENWQINNIVGVAIDTWISPPPNASSYMCGQSSDPSMLINTGSKSVLWVAENGSGVVGVNSSGVWTSSRCNCPCPQVGSPNNQVPALPNPNIPCNKYAPYNGSNYPFTHLSFMYDDGVINPTNFKLYVEAGSRNQLNKTIDTVSWGAPLNEPQFFSTPIARFCPNCPPNQQTTTRWNSATAYFRLGGIGLGVGNNNDAEGFVLYNGLGLDGSNLSGITVNYQGASNSFQEQTSGTFLYSNLGGPVPTGQQPIGTIWVGGEDVPQEYWQLDNCNQNGTPDLIFTTTNLAAYDDDVISNIQINGQQDIQCWSVTGPILQSALPQNASIVTITVNVATVQVFADNVNNCYTCTVGCYQLISCDDPTDIRYVYTQNPTVINQLIGALYQTIQSPLICNNECFYLIRCQGTPTTTPIDLDTIVSGPNASLELTVYNSCAECKGTPPRQELKPRAIKPGFYTPGCPPDYTMNVNSNYGEQVFDEMVAIRYGIEICCYHDVDKWDIKKELLDLKAIYDDCACENSSKPCPVCVEPCNVSAEATGYIIGEDIPPVPPPACVNPNIVSVKTNRTN